MKKLVFAFAALVGLFVLGACSEKAETLLGEWTLDSVKVEDNTNMNINMNLNLKADGKQATAINLVMDGNESGMKIHFPMAVSYEGTWNSDEKMIVLVADTASVKFDFNPDSLTIQAESKETESLIELMRPKLNEAMKKQFADPKSDFGKEIVLADTFDYQLLPGELKLTARKDGAVLNFKRK